MDHYNEQGVRQSHFNGIDIEFPYVHEDFAILNTIRKTWPPPEFIHSVYHKNSIVAQPRNFAPFVLSLYILQPFATKKYIQKIAGLKLKDH